MAYEKFFNEIYAITALKYFWRGYEKGFVKWESPDWYHEKAGIGIEVSQALLPKDGQEENFIETYLGKHKAEIPEEAARRYENRLYFYNDRLWALLDDGTSSVPCEEKILVRFRSKLAKLNANYLPCETNALYLFAHAEPNEKTVSRLQEQMAEIQRSEARRFDLIFLDCNSTLYILDFRQNETETIPIPEKARLFLNEEAETLRRSFTNKSGAPYE